MKLKVFKIVDKLNKKVDSNKVMTQGKFLVIDNRVLKRPLAF